MTVVAVVLLAVAAVAGAFVWYAVEHRRPSAGTRTWLAAAAVPVVLVGAAALAGLAGDPAGEELLGFARAAAVVAAVTGGSVVATALLRVADRGASAADGPAAGSETGSDLHPGSRADVHDVGAAGSVSAAESVSAADSIGAAGSIGALGHMGPLGPLGVVGSSGAADTSGPVDTSSAVGGDATATVSDPQTLRGGTSIGALERVAVAVTLLAGWPEGLALVLGVKGLGRYPELRRPAAAERFIIGTLASVLWAVATVGVVVAIQT